MRWMRHGAHRLLKVRLWTFRHGGHWSEALNPDFQFEIAEETF
jgi:hypothetical protein